MMSRTRRVRAARDGGDGFNDLGPLQREIVAIVWMLEEPTVNDVREHLASEGRELAYTTVLSALQKLEKAGWLTHRAEGRSYRYRVLKSRERERRRSLRRLLRQLFGGDRALLLQHLLADGEVTRPEARALTQLVREHARRTGHG